MHYDYEKYMKNKEGWLQRRIIKKIIILFFASLHSSAKQDLTTDSGKMLNINSEDTPEITISDI